MKSTFHGGITYQGFSTGSGKSTGVPCAAWPVPPDHRIGVAASAPEPCSVPWPDNFSEDEMKWQYQSVTSGMQLEAGTPAEDVDLMTATSGDDLLPDEGAARQTWAARTGDETEEDLGLAESRGSNHPGWRFAMLPLRTKPRRTNHERSAPCLVCRSL